MKSLRKRRKRNAKVHRKINNQATLNRLLLPMISMSKLSFIYASFFLAFILAYPLQAFGQQNDSSAPRMLFASAHTNASCELAAALDVLAAELKDNPEANGYIVIYNRHNDPPGLFHRHALGVKNVLVNKEHIAPDRIIIVNGGTRESFLAEYWLVPKDASPPKSGSVWIPDLQQIEFGKFDEFFWGMETEDLYEYGKTATQLDGFAQALIKNPDAVGYIIGYAGSESMTKPSLEYKDGKVKAIRPKFRMTGKKVARSAGSSLAELKINPARVILIDGGYREFATVELWLVKAGEAAPKPTPTTRKRNN